ncbi:hypothetical protein KQX54_009741 [Cotesia glomerata]|nr:hypothetical protein KQX54_009741 [Cotesia glomerata]
MIGKISLTFNCAILLACACQISMAGVIAPVVAAPLAAAPLPAAAPLVGYAHAVPHNIPPHASRVDISTRALAAPYVVAPAVSAPIISAPTAPVVAAHPGFFGAPFAAYRSAAIFG